MTPPKQPAKKKTAGPKAKTAAKKTAGPKAKTPKKRTAKAGDLVTTPRGYARLKPASKQRGLL